VSGGRRPGRRGGRWITEAPTHCPQGHELGPNQVLVGHVACSGHGGGGHTIWHCVECEGVVYSPPLAAHCAALEGPAKVRSFAPEDYSVREPEPPPF
jgi:hypothetical protein